MSNRKFPDYSLRELIKQFLNPTDLEEYYHVKNKLKHKFYIFLGWLILIIINLIGAYILYVENNDY